MIAWFAGQLLPIQIGLAILAAALLAGLAILSYFRFRKFLELKALKDLEVKDRVGLKIEFIKTAAQILGGAFFLVTIYVAWQNLIVSQEKHTTDLYTKAIAQLGSEKMEVRLGGIYALERIARDSEKDHGPIMEVLTAYVREKVPWPPKKANASKEPPAETKEPAPGQKQPETTPSPEGKLPTDIQAILTVLGRRTRIYKKGDQRLDLGQTDLRVASLFEAHLEGADLFGAHLEGAKLWEAQLKEADLQSADLQKALQLTVNQVRHARNWVLAYLPEDLLAKLSLPNDHNQRLRHRNLRRYSLRGMDLRGAYLGFWNLRGTNLHAARLKGADLRGTDLRGAFGLTKEQIDSAITDEKTKLPDYLKKTGPNKAEPK